jgi:uncharacterized coiled-coil protein SlyX
MNRLIQLKTAFALVLACLAVSPLARAVIPAPDGGYPGANTAEGDNALFSLTSGSYNTALGASALIQTTTGYYNTAVGAQALFSNIGGYYNTATGLQALYSNTSGNYNSAYGVSALTNNTSGNYNTATGYNSMVRNTTGIYNTGYGTQTLFSNTSGQSNTAIGLQALYGNTTGIENTATGVGALTSNITGYSNTATGVSALQSNTSGYYNTATGNLSLFNNTAGAYNTASGFGALANNSTGSFNTALGDFAGQGLTTGSYNISIGYGLVNNAADAGTIRIGNSNQTKTFISGIYGVTATSGVAVYVNSNGQLGTATSSARYKEDIKPMEKASEAILGLTPVTFRYKHELDPDGIPQFGLVAEEVAKVNPDLVAKDAEGKVYTVRYEAVNAMLLNEFLKAHKKARDQEATITQLQTTVAKQSATIAQQQQGMEVFTTSLKEQASQIQKVSARIEAGRSAPRTGANAQ